MFKLKFRFLLLVTTILILCGSSSFAQQAISPEKRGLIHEFLEAAGCQKSVNEIIEAMIAVNEKETPKMISSLIENDKNFRPAEKQQLQQSMSESAERVGKRFREFFTHRLNIGMMLEEVSYPIYDQNFTEGELRDLITFYRTPTGKQMISVVPKMMMEAMTAFGEKLTPKVQEFMTETVETELVFLKQKLQSGIEKKRVLNPRNC